MHTQGSRVRHSAKISMKHKFLFKTQQYVDLPYSATFHNLRGCLFRHAVTLNAKRTRIMTESNNTRNATKLKIVGLKRTPNRANSQHSFYFLNCSQSDCVSK